MEVKKVVYSGGELLVQKGVAVVGGEDVGWGESMW